MKYLCVIAAALVCASCSKPLNVKVLEADSSRILVVDEGDVTEERDIKLSDFAEDFRIVRFDNDDKAFFTPGLPAISENYIVAGKDPVKLFDRNGKYLCDIGAIGNGPGEYAIGVYDRLIDESEGKIYLTDFVRSAKCYDLQGNFLYDVKLGGNLNKGKLFKNADGTMSIVHLGFRNDPSPFVAASFNTVMGEGDTVRYAFAPQLSCDFETPEGKAVGFDNEVWSFRCTSSPSFHTTFNDTLYHYDATANRLDAAFILNMDRERKGAGYFVYQELPGHIIANIVGGDNRGRILVDKNTLQAWRVGRRINDFFFNIDDMGWNMRDGYAFGMYEPLELQEKLQKAIDEGQVDDEFLPEVTKFMDTLHENDNNVMIIARLKK